MCFLLDEVFKNSVPMTFDLFYEFLVRSLQHLHFLLSSRGLNKGAEARKLYYSLIDGNMQIVNRLTNPILFVVGLSCLRKRMFGRILTFGLAKSITDRIKE